MLAVFAAPMSAAGSSTKLSGATVTPRTGTVTTTIVITVLYQNAKGFHAPRVTATVGQSISSGRWASAHACATAAHSRAA